MKRAHAYKPNIRHEIPETGIGAVMDPAVHYEIKMAYLLGTWTGLSISMLVGLFFGTMTLLEWRKRKP
jgi:hypothetical protein